ncbi:hypothetical protein O9K51_01305 [Purpureocillium lavendulum]|uniref:Antifungal protein n=1 Tax=Purpureocillium lavendulum TaxID=1247861 RepID=A0AB34G4J7_9HYPO|nr:hypothetical protein O9K51_01305 [Purpureocillium lavendulum]
MKASLVILVTLGGIASAAQYRGLRTVKDSRGHDKQEWYQVKATCSSRAKCTKTGNSCTAGSSGKATCT